MNFRNFMILLLSFAMIAVVSVPALAQQSAAVQPVPEPEGDEDDMWGQETASPIRLQMVGIEVSDRVRDMLADTGAATPGGGYLPAGANIGDAVSRAVAKTKKEEPKPEEKEEKKSEWYQNTWFIIAVSSVGGLIVLIVAISILVWVIKKPKVVSAAIPPSSMPQASSPQSNIPPQAIPVGGTTVAALLLPDGKTVPMMSAEISIGKSAGNQLVLAGEGILDRHARVFYLENGQYYIENFGVEGSLTVNGQPTQRAPINVNDRITVGTQSFSFGTTNI